MTDSRQMMAALVIVLLFFPGRGSIRAAANAAGSAQPKPKTALRFDVLEDQLNASDAVIRHAAADDLLKTARSSPASIEPTGGIGVLISDNLPQTCLSSGRRFSSILEGSPADLARIRSDDSLLEIDGVRVCSLLIEDARKRLRGPIGSKVRVKVGQGREVTLTRAAVGQTDPQELLVRLISEALESSDAYVKGRARKACEVLNPRPMVCRVKVAEKSRKE